MNTLRGGQRSNCIPSCIYLMDPLSGGQRPNCIPSSIDLMNPLRVGRDLTVYCIPEGWAEIQIV